MALTNMVLVTGGIVVLTLLVTCAFCLDPRYVRRSVAESDQRLADFAPYLAAAAVFFLFKQVTSGASLRLSRAIDWDVTDELYAIEGLFVADLQGIVPDALYPSFSALYMFGFPYLLAVPLVAYFLLPSRRYLKEVLVAYVLNYVVGAICYTVFIAYGPRNRLPTLVDEPMYRMFPQTQELTAAVSSNTDVFPSLHASLSVVVLLFAWRTRREFPRWVPIASVVATGVVLSTMVLGIHWLVDVVGGIGLAVGSVVAAIRIVSREEGDARSRSGPDPTPTPSSEDVEEGVTSEIGD